MTDNELHGVCLYLGYGKNNPDENTESVIRSVYNEYSELVCEKSIRQEFDITVCGDVITFSQGERTVDFSSGKLASHLDGCEKAVIFAATLGALCDRLMIKHEIADIAKAAVCQGCGAYLIEELCDKISQSVEAEYGERGYSARSRFSPGYGDFPLEAQKDIFQLLECRRIGLTLTDSLLMVPTKSVTAIIGLEQQ